MNSKFLVLLTEEGEIDEDEVLCLREMMKRDGYLTDRRKRFDLSKIPSEDRSLDFRFNRSQLEILCEVLHFPQYFLTDEEHTQREIPAMEGLCILLRRLSYPNRLHDLEKEFGTDASVLSRIFNMVLDYVYDHFCNRFKTPNQSWITSDVLQS